MKVSANRFKKPTEHQNRLLASLAAVPASQQINPDASWFPPVDILEDDSHYLFRVDLPGLKPESIRVTIEQDALSISGLRPLGNDRRKRLRVERPSGHFLRRFALPDDASRTTVGATLGDCVLELHVPKTQEQDKPSPESVEIQVRPV